MRSLNELITNFFEFCSGFKPYPWQNDFLNDNNRFITIRAGRQLGKTECVAIKVLWEVINKNQQVLIVSSSQRQSDTLYSRIRYYVKNAGLENYLLIDTREKLKFRNNSEIYSLPGGNDGSTIRGYSPNILIFEEAAFIKEAVFEAVEPSLAHTGGKLWLISTPFGMSGFFYETFGKDYFSKYHVPASKNLYAYSGDWLDNKKHELGETSISYIQEYEAEFIAETDNWFNLNLIKKCVCDGLEEERPVSSVRYFLGVDLARFGTDESVFVITRHDAQGIKVVKIINTNKKPITDSIGRIKQLYNEWKFENILIDETGLGAGAVDVLKEARLPVSPITFTNEIKFDLYSNLKWLMENEKLKYPNCGKLLRQLQELQYKISSSSNYLISHPDTPNAHDDYTDALALSVFTKKRKPSFAARGV